MRRGLQMERERSQWCYPDGYGKVVEAAFQQAVAGRGGAIELRRRKSCGRTHQLRDVDVLKSGVHQQELKFHIPCLDGVKRLKGRIGHRDAVELGPGRRSQILNAVSVVDLENFKMLS